MIRRLSDVLVVECVVALVVGFPDEIFLLEVGECFVGAVVRDVCVFAEFQKFEFGAVRKLEQYPRRCNVSHRTKQG